MLISAAIAVEAVQARATTTLGEGVLRQAPALGAVAVVPDLPASDLETRAALAANLINLGNQLSDQGRHGEALAATEEGVAMFRALADTGPAFRAQLA